jgi:hypothetical protein
VDAILVAGSKGLPGQVGKIVAEANRMPSFDTVCSSSANIGHLDSGLNRCDAQHRVFKKNSALALSVARRLAVSLDRTTWFDFAHIRSATRTVRQRDAGHAAAGGTGAS